MMSSYISCCATFYLLILHQYKLCIACRCSVFSWFLLALKSDIKHSTVSVYLTSNPGENYLSNCQLEWCSTFVHPLNFCVCVCEFQPLFFTREKVVPSDPHCFVFFLVYCPSVRLIRAAGRNKRNSSPSYLWWLIPPTSSGLFLVGAH